MKLWATLPLLLLLLLASGMARASANLEPLDLNHIDEATLGKHLMFLEDPQGVLMLDDILTDDYQSRFEPVFVDTPYFGRTRSTYWFRLQVVPAKSSSPRLIEIGYPHLKSITLYEMQGDRLLRSLKSGYENRSSDYNNCLRFCFLIKGNHGIHTLYFRISTDSPMFVPMMLRAPEKQLLNERINMAVVALFYGAFVVMGLFNLFVYFSTQDRSYLYYVLYIMALFLWTSSHDGLLREVLLYRSEVLSSYRIHFLLTLVPILFGALFCQRFLRTAETMPLHHRVFSFLIVLCLLDAGLTLVSGRILLPDSVNLLTVTFSIAGVSASIRGLQQGLRTARFFLTAWVAVIIGSVVWVLTLSGVLPFNAFTAFSVHIGGLLETVLLSLALGDRINLLQSERIQVEQDAKRRLEESNQKLEASNRFKDEFLSTVSHELRTPMNGIIGASELLDHTELNSEQYKYLST
ncbi:MAG TPA: 7TM diverse intracellular signaling domain-containing protein, partial [Dongiaceae bacterium]|nr:7TM diverse intracellular signaling domain-containing protein [Dongiaceae bacterium]